MSNFCEIALALGLGFSGLCEAPPSDSEIVLPAEDPSYWEFKEPVQEPEPKIIEKVIVQPAPPPPPPPPAFPPVIITKTIVEKPPVVIKKETPPPPKPKRPPKPDPIRVWLEQGGNRIYHHGHIKHQPLTVASYRAPTRVLKQDLHLGATLPVSNKNVENADTAQIPTLQISDDLKAPQQKQAAKPKLSQESYESEAKESSLPVDNTRILGEDRFITGLLETAINTQIDSEHGGSVIIQTTEHVFGYHQRSIIIPMGSRLICEYEGPSDAGSTRISLICKRILMGEHRAEIINLDAPVSDQEGKAGIFGEVDRKFWAKYGSSLALGGVASLVRLSSAFVDNDGDDQRSALGQTIDAGSQELSQKFGEITAAILEDTVNLKPVIKIKKGTRVKVRLSGDWAIRKVGTTNKKSKSKDNS